MEALKTKGKGGCAMTDREKLLIALMSSDDEPDDGGVTVFEVAAMLYELGDEYRRRPHLILAPV